MNHEQGERRDCPRTRFPDGTVCGEYGWHAPDCPERPERQVPLVETARVRAVLRLIGSEHLTPVGRRQIEAVLDEAEGERSDR